MALASVPLGTARSLLNDPSGTRWTDAVLIPFIQEAQRELIAKLDLEGIPVINNQTAVLTVPAGTTDLTTVGGYPINLISPVQMKERAVGQQLQDFVEMTECDFLPDLQQSTELIWWAWIGERIMLLGALNDVQVQLRYIGSVPPINFATDPIGFIFGENYLGHRTAALAADAAGNISGYQNWTAEANVKLQEVIQMNVKRLQNLPARKRPYHRGRGRSRVVRDF